MIIAKDITKIVDRRLKTFCDKLRQSGARTSMLLSVGALIVLALSASYVEAGSRFGDGPDIRLLGNGRDIELLADFKFWDLSGEVWVAKKGSVANGASIPQVFWSYMGGPFSGKFRNASIIHDYYYTVRTRTKEAVDQNFYEAMLVSGVRKSKAWVMYKAVRWFGGHWEVKTPSGCIDGDTINFENCVQNSGEKPALLPGRETSKAALNEFFGKLEQEGYAEEVKIAREKTVN